MSAIASEKQRPDRPEASYASKIRLDRSGGVDHGLAIDWPKLSGGKYRSMELPDARKQLWLANARQNGHLGLWKQYEEEQSAQNMSD
ncbi:hypothetical protein [Ruegeria arenilitoris]|uniref:hypothetical protein n=1 Tax=Ruegeria arenilitoris TaxID=1173585 RepID=UPI001C95D9EC|nr:hypothetical protein [Ruegeria arenilitoris]MBY6082066.1 hypothetical protein [Ruegeria arenilitoris]